MVKSEKNKDLILEIDAGIKKEISVGCCVKSKICSICGADHKESSCLHTPGEIYDDKICFLTLSQPLDAYEWSFVAVPAQINAGVIKNYNKYKLPTSNIISAVNPAKIKKALNDSLNDKQSCYISEESTKTLIKYIATLEKDSSIAKDSINELKTNVYKMMVISQPSLSQFSINNIINNLSYQELKKLKDNLCQELEISTDFPQLSTISSEYFKDSDENNMFKI